ncbi:MAG: holo-ACP synthase [Spirochaetota bacterium]
MIYGIGVDLVYIPRIASICDKHSRHFLKRILSENELTYIKSLKFPLNSIASRFAAKEAYSKALGCGIGEYAKFKEISIEKSGKGKPEVILNGDTKKYLNKFFKENNKTNYYLQLSLSHDKDYAIAYIIIELY